MNIFKSEQWEIIEAGDGIAGLKMARSERPDLICLDVILPGLSGFEVCHKIRRDPLISSVPILMVTSLTKKEDVVKGLKSGANDYIVKPFSHLEVLARVKASLDTKMIMKDLEERSSSFQLAWEVLEATTSTLDIRQVLFSIVEKAALVLKANRCSIITVEKQGPGDEAPLSGQVLASHDDPEIGGINIHLEKYPEILRAFETGEYVLIENIQNDPIMESVRDRISSLGDQSIMAVPLSFRGEVLGALLLRTTRDGIPFSREDITMARLIAGASSNALRNAYLFERIELKNERLLNLNEELKRANIELENLSKMKSDFVSMVSHELRTPLTSIIGFSELLAEEHVGELTGDQEDYIRQILRKSKDLLTLINDLLDSGSLETGKIAMRFREIELNPIISSVLSSTRHVTDVQPVVNPLIPDDLPSFEADAEKVTQVLTNLVTNALKFSPPGSPVDIRAGTIMGRRESDKADLIHISVVDRGMGIHEDHRDLVFERFFQVEQGTARSHRGAGLGLYITKSFVELHGGKIWVESTLGEGATFHFTLPLSQA